MPADKKLIRESEWMRVFKIENEEKYLYESKFLIDNLRLPVSVIKDRWPSFSRHDKEEFATAFSTQPPRDDNDRAILQYLMETGPQEVWRNIAVLVPFHPNRSDALTFLIDKVQQDDSRANYYQAIESLRGTQAEPALRQHFDGYRSLLGPQSSSDDDVRIWADYLQCTKTLFVLTHNPIFLSALKKGRADAPAELQTYAANILREAEQAES